MSKIRKAVWKVTYEGVDITVGIGPFVEKITYSDELHGKSDELTLTVNDAEDLWRRGWYPSKAAKIALDFGLEGGPRQSAGSFEVDEIELNFSADSGATLEIKALSAGVTTPMRTQETKAHEAVNLAEIARTYADKHGLKLIGEIPEIKLARVTQHRESDLGFLVRMAEEHGACVAVKDGQLLFTQRASLKDGAAIAIGRKDLLEARLKDKSLQTYKAAEVSYSDPASGKTLHVTVEAKGIASGDIHKIQERVESHAQAVQRAEAALARLNAGERGGSLRLPGDPAFAAGGKIALGEGFGRLSGIYLIEKARHSFSPKDGYTTEIEIKTP